MVWFPKQNLPSKLWRYAKYSITLQYIYLISEVVYLINPYRCRWVGQNLCCTCGQTWSMHKWVNLRRSSEFRQDTDCKQIRTRRLCKILFVVMVSLQTLFFCYLCYLIARESWLGSISWKALLWWKTLNTRAPYVACNKIKKGKLKMGRTLGWEGKMSELINETWIKVNE